MKKFKKRDLERKVHTELQELVRQINWITSLLNGYETRDPSKYDIDTYSFVKIFGNKYIDCHGPTEVSTDEIFEKRKELIFKCVKLESSLKTKEELLQDLLGDNKSQYNRFKDLSKELIISALQLTYYNKITTDLREVC